MNKIIDWKIKGLKIFDQIGYFKGEPISEMNREQLLEFAKWAGDRIVELQNKENKELLYGVPRKI